MYSAIKKIEGFSTCFRQEKAAPIHCSLLHGYSISFEVEFEANQLDDRQWVIDFGFLNRSDYRVILDDKPLTIGEWFKYMFDHTVVVAKDDSQLETFKLLNLAGAINLRVVDYVGCERFAELVFKQLETFLIVLGEQDRVKVKRVVCIENSKNSASYYK